MTPYQDVTGKFLRIWHENQMAVNSDVAAVRIEARWKQMLITR